MREGAKIDAAADIENGGGEVLMKGNNEPEVYISGDHVRIYFTEEYVLTLDANMAGRLGGTMMDAANMIKEKNSAH